MKRKRITIILVVLIIIALALGFGWYKYSHKDKGDGVLQSVNTKSKNGYNYKLLSTKNDFDIWNNKYILEYDADKEELYKISDFEGNVYFEGKQPYQSFIYGVDKNMYVVTDDLNEEGNTIVLYRLKDKKFEEVVKLHDDNYYYSEVLYEKAFDKDSFEYDESEDCVLGFYGAYIDYDENGNIITKKDDIYYPLNGKKTLLKDITFKGAVLRLSIDQNLVTNEKDYISFYKYSKNKDAEPTVGLYSLKDEKVVVDATYDELVYQDAGKYIVSKKNKAGIIDTNENKLVDLEYDFIDDHNSYLVVSKNNKMAIMNKEYKVITDYFLKYPGGEYIYELCCANRNSFFIQKYGDKYLYFVDNDYLTESEDGDTQEDEEDVEPVKKISKNEIYIINKDYSLEKIEADDYYLDENAKLLFLSSDKENKIYVYDNKLNYKFEIDLSKYNLKTDEVYFNADSNVIYDLDNDLYFDIKTGKNLEDKKLVKEINNIKLSYEKDHVDILLDGKKVHSIKTDYPLPVEEYDNGYYVYYQSDKDNDEIAIFTKK